MPNWPIKDTRKHTLNNNFTDPTTNYNHGLIALPAENLTHITAYLDPFSLYALSKVCSAFNAHVNEEHTWRSAFLLNFLGIPPESDILDGKGLLLRRSEPTWKREYITRSQMQRRWDRSRTSTVIHAPVQSSIHKIHILPSTVCLTSSLQYGIVSRSFPLTGKVIRGFFSSSAGNGLGIGNPNTELSPDVSACDLTSDGGTAKIVWGFASGRVAAMTAAKASDASTKSAGKLLNCAVQDQHFGPVLDIVWDTRTSSILSASMDGTVKLWDPKSLVCLSTWGDLNSPHTCTKLVSALASGFFAVGMSNGDVSLWMGVERDNAGIPIRRGHAIGVPCPNNTPRAAPPVISDMHLDVSVRTFASLLLTYQDHPYYYRIDCAGDTQEVTQFGDSSCGSITSICPCFALKADEASFILVGDILGWISVYPWTTTTGRPIRRFEVHKDGYAVTRIAYNNVALAAGSQYGTVKVFDASTLRHIRTISSLEPRRGVIPSPISDIVLSPTGDAIVVSAGHHVLAWEAGQVKNAGRGGVRGRHRGGPKPRKTPANSKGHYQFELQSLIKESMALLKSERKTAERAVSRERKEMSNLEALGFSEAEAVEYLLILSREEAEQKERQSASSSTVAPPDEGVFEVDLEARGAQVPASARPDSRIASPISSCGATPSPDRSVFGSFAKADFPTFSSRPASATSSAWRSPRSWNAVTQVDPSPPGTPSPASISPSGFASERLRRQQQEEADLRLAIELSFREM